MTVRAFTAAWDEAEARRVIRRVAETRLPWTPAGAGWSLGCDVEVLARIQAFWAGDYDPAAALAWINRYPQVIAHIDGVELHAVHVRGEAARPRPVLLCHGWPGSVLEFRDVIAPLAWPSRHGGRAEDAVDLVIPSLPGFGFSGKPPRSLGPRATAGLFHRLMTEALGYSSYAVQGGDWGSVIATWLGADHPAAVRGVHLNTLALLQPDPPADAAEAAWLKAERRARRERGDYIGLQSRRPMSLALAAADNPLGQAAWLLERYHDWSDLGGRPLDQVFGLERLVTTVMLYVMTGSFSSAAYFYHAAALEAVAAPGVHPVCRVPTAYAAFPGDPMAPIPPRSRAEPIYDLRRWTQMPRGGHFPAWQEPALFADDVRAFVNSLHGHPGAPPLGELPRRG